MQDDKFHSVPQPQKSSRLKIILLVALLALAYFAWQTKSDRDRASSNDPTIMEQVAREKPNDLKAQLKWGEYLIGIKQFEQAGMILAYARTLSPNNPEIDALQGMLMAKAGHGEQARERLDKALARDPSNLTALHALANLNASERKLDEAIKGFERITQLQPRDADAWQRLGLLLIGARQNYRGLDAMMKSAELNPADLFTQTSVGNLSLQAGRIEQASKAYQIVLAKEPNNPQALTGQARATMRLEPSPEGLKKADRLATSSLEITPSYLTYYVRGQIRMNLRRLPEAIADLKESISLNPKNIEPYVLLSQCYSQTGNRELALKASREFDRLKAQQLESDRSSTPRK